MYLLYCYVALGTVKTRERRKRSDNVLVKLCSHWYCKERKEENDRTMSLLNWAAISTVRGEKIGKQTLLVWYDPVDVTIVYGSNSFLCVYWRRVKILSPLVATSLEGLQWWSLIISLNVQGNRKKSKKKKTNNNKIGKQRQCL